MLAAELTARSSSGALLEELGERVTATLMEEGVTSTLSRLRVIRIFSIVESLAQLCRRMNGVKLETRKSCGLTRLGRTWLGQDLVRFVQSRHFLLRPSFLVRVSFQRGFAARERKTKVPECE